MSTIILKPAGQPIPKVDKRAIESVLYTLDCAELLDQHELISAIDMPDPKPGLTINSLRPRRGRNIEVRVENDPLTNAQYVDHSIQLLFTTIFNNKKLAVFNLRVHK